MLKGINALNQGKPLGICADIAAAGFESVRASASYDGKPWAPIPEFDLVPLVQEIRDVGMVPYISVRDGASVDRLPADASPIVEHGNEPDLKKQFGWPSFAFYDKTMWTTINACERRGFPCVVGVVSNPNDRGRDYLKKVFGKKNERIPRWVHAALHWYAHSPRPGHFEMGHDGLSIEQEIDEVFEIIGCDRELYVSELGGWSTSEHGFSEEEIAQRYAAMLTVFARRGVKIVHAYQVNDGDPNKKGADFGFRTADGSWKARTRAFTGVEVA